MQPPCRMRLRRQSPWEERQDRFNMGAPEGGWGWLVVVGVGITFAVTTGPVMCFWLIFDKWLRDVGAGTSDVTFLSGLYLALSFMPGVLARRLLGLFSCRQVCSVGAALCSAGVVFAAFCDSVAFLVVSFSLLQGVGMGLLLPAAYTCLTAHFRRRRTLAVATAQLLAATGIALYPVLANHLFLQYGFRGAQAILGALSLHAIAGAACMRAPPPRHRPSAPSSRRPSAPRPYAFGDEMAHGHGHGDSYVGKKRLSVGPLEYNEDHRPSIASFPDESPLYEDPIAEEAEENGGEPRVLSDASAPAGLAHSPRRVLPPGPLMSGGAAYRQDFQRSADAARRASRRRSCQRSRRKKRRRGHKPAVSFDARPATYIEVSPDRSPVDERTESTREEETEEERDEPRNSDARENNAECEKTGGEEWKNKSEEDLEKDQKNKEEDEEEEEEEEKEEEEEEEEWEPPPRPLTARERLAQRRPTGPVRMHFSTQLKPPSQTLPPLRRLSRRVSVILLARENEEGSSSEEEEDDEEQFALPPLPSAMRQRKQSVVVLAADAAAAAVSMEIALMRTQGFAVAALGGALALFSDGMWCALAPLHAAAQLGIVAAGPGAAWGVVAAGSAGEVVGRAALVAGNRWAQGRARLVFLAACIASIPLSCAYAWTFGAEALVAQAAALGALRGCRQVALPLLFAERFGSAGGRFPTVFGLFLLVAGLTHLLLGPFVGLVRDASGSYPACLSVLGTLPLLCVVPWTVEWILHPPPAVRHSLLPLV